MAIADTLPPYREILRTEVDGLPTFWFDGPRPFTAAIHFRVGVCDERLPTRGLTHLVEHLALFPLRELEVDFNATVFPTSTIFWAQGHPDRVGEFIREVTRSIHDLRFDRLDLERRVLRAEREDLGPSPFGVILSSYYGYFGPGLIDTPEYGLDHLGEDEIKEWATRYFNAGNAALAIVGKPPQSWGIELPDGDRVPPGPFQPLDPMPSQPMLAATQDLGLTWATLARRREGVARAAGGAAMEILVRRLESRLRHELGHTYSVLSDWLSLDVDHLAVWLGFDAHPEDSAAAATEFMTEAASLAQSGPTVEELDRYRRRLASLLDDQPDDIARSDLAQTADAFLQGFGEPWQPDRLFDVLDQLTPEDVRETFTDDLDRSLILANVSPELLPFAEDRFPSVRRPEPGVQFVAKLRYLGRLPAAFRIGAELFQVGTRKGWFGMPIGWIAMVSEPKRGVLRIDSAPAGGDIPIKGYRSWRGRMVGTAVLMALLVVLATFVANDDLVVMATLGLVVAAVVAVVNLSRLPPGLNRGVIREPGDMREVLTRHLPPGVFLPPPKS